MTIKNIRYIIYVFAKENERRGDMSFNLQRLKAERMAEGYTQEEFAKKLGMSRGAYAKREAGIVDISVEDLSRIMDVLGYDASKVSIFFAPSVR